MYAVLLLNVSGVKRKFRGAKATLKQTAPPYDADYPVNVVSTTVRAIFESMEPKTGPVYVV